MTHKPKYSPNPHPNNFHAVLYTTVSTAAVFQQIQQISICYANVFYKMQRLGSDSFISWGPLGIIITNRSGTFCSFGPHCNWRSACRLLTPIRNTTSCWTLISASVSNSQCSLDTTISPVRKILVTTVSEWYSFLGTGCQITGLIISNESIESHFVESCFPSWRSYNSWMDFDIRYPAAGVYTRNVCVCTNLCCQLYKTLCWLFARCQSSLKPVNSIDLLLVCNCNRLLSLFRFFFFFFSTSLSLQWWQCLIRWCKSALIWYCRFWIKVSTLICTDLYEMI